MDRHIGSTLPTLGKQRLRLWIRLLRTTRRLEAEVRERLKAEFATTLPRFDVLAGLYRAEGGLTMTELSRALMVSNGNVTGIVERLVSDGMIVREPIENDRRATRVALTGKGRQGFVRMAAAHENWINELLAPLGRGDTEELLALMAQVAPADAAR
jgi:DNA-binding MarR family transcriptional regulator